MTFRQEILDWMGKCYDVQGGRQYKSQYEWVDGILNIFEKRIDEKIQHVNEVLNDSRLTIQGCQRLKGKKDAFEEMMEMLK